MALLWERSKVSITSAFAAIAFIGISASLGVAQEVNSSRKVRVAAIAINYSKDISQRIGIANISKIQSSDTWTVFGNYERLTRKAALEGAQLVVWPEYGAWVLGKDLKDYQDRVVELARTSNAIITAGYIDSGSSRNSVLMATPSGEKKIYNKKYLVPGGESTWQRPGRKAYGMLPVNILGLDAAVRICYDNDFPRGSRQAVLDGAGLFINPSADDANISDRHAAQHQMRSMENARPMVRSTLRGVSFLTDRSGAILEKKEILEPGEVAYLIGDVHLSRKKTFYTRHGDWVLIVAGLILVGLLLKHWAIRQA